MRNYHKKDKPILDHRITLRFEAPDYTAIERRAMQAEISVAEYCRKAILGKRITIKQKTVIEIPVIKELIAALGKIGANLNQIAHHFNTGGVLSQQMYRETMKVYADLYAMKFEIEKLGVNFVAILKHIAVKNSDEGQKQQYLPFQHERDSAKPIQDDGGRLIPCDGGVAQGIDCDPFSFSTERVELNCQWERTSNVP